MEIGQEFFCLVKRVPGQGPEQRESSKTVLYLLIVIILLFSYIIIKLLIKRRTIPAKARNRTPGQKFYLVKSISRILKFFKELFALIKVNSFSNILVGNFSFIKVYLQVQFQVAFSY